MNGLEKTVSWAGCFCTVVLVVAVTIVSVIYSINFLQKKDKLIYSLKTGLQRYPFIDLAEQKFFIYVYGYYYGEEFEEEDETKFVNIKANFVSQERKDGWEIKETRLQLVDCQNMKLNISDVNIQKEWLEDTKCLEFPPQTKIGGSFREDSFSYIELYVDSCEDDCQINGIPIT